MPKVTKKGIFFNPTGENKREPIINLNVGHSLKMSYSKRGYEQSMENYPLITDYEKYKDLYSSKEVIITGIIEDSPIQDEFHLGTLYAPYVLLSQNDFQTLTGQTGYRIISIDMKEDATEAEY